MKRLLAVTLIVMLCLALACTTMQQQWDKLTPDEKARVVIADMQNQLNTLFDTGKQYVTLHPEAKEVWKEKAVPAFDLANKALEAAIKISSTQGITPDELYQVVAPLIDKVLQILTDMGVNTGGKT